MLLAALDSKSAKSRGLSHSAGFLGRPKAGRVGVGVGVPPALTREIFPCELADALKCAILGRIWAGQDTAAGGYQQLERRSNQTGCLLAVVTQCSASVQALYCGKRGNSFQARTDSGGHSSAGNQMTAIM